MAYKTKNRQEFSRPGLELVLITDEGEFKYTPNTLIIETFMKKIPNGTLKGEVSVLSGKPAMVYEADDLRIPLTYDELVRFIMIDMRPDEFHKMVAQYGMAYEWHSDFYDEETGEALQPRENYL